jgi:DNA-binding transcriptional LysR family regulator
MPLSKRTPDLESLDLLVTIADAGSIGRAAERLGLSQPGASLKVRALERRLGVAMLDRSTSGSQLTAAGSIVVGMARPLLALAADLASGVAVLRGEQHDRLDVAASMTVAEYLLPEWLVALHAELPETSVALQVANSAAVEELVRNHEAAIGFIEGMHAPRRLRSKRVCDDELVVVVGSAHRWAKRARPISAGELATTPLILREEGSGTRETLEQLMETHGGLARPALELASTTAIKAAVATGGAPAVVSHLAVRHEVAEGRLVRVEVADLLLRRYFRATWSAARPPKGSASALMTLATRSGRRRSIGAAATRMG